MANTEIEKVLSEKVLSEIEVALFSKVERFLVTEEYDDFGDVRVFFEEYTGQNYEPKSVKRNADVYQYVVTGMDAVNAAFEAAREA